MIEPSHPYTIMGKTIALIIWSFPGGSDGKASAYNAGDPGSIPAWEDPLEKEMATHSSTLAWKIPWMEEHGRLQSMGSQRVGHGWATSLHLTSSQQRGATSCSRSGAVAERSNARSKGQRLGGGGPRGATPCSRSGGVAMRRYPSSKVRSSGWALLEIKR